MDGEGPTIQVNRKGTIIVPKSVVERFGRRPGDFVDITDLELRKSGMTRKAFLKLIKKGGVTLAVLADVFGLTEFFHSKYREAQQTDQQLVTQVFGSVSSAQIAAVPARNHPFNPLGENESIYPIEAECLMAYLDRFTTAYEEEIAEGLPDIHPADDIVVFGSQVSNLLARELLGNPYRQEVLSEVIYTPAGTVPLRWNLRMDTGTPMKMRRQYGVEWHFHEHALHDFEIHKDLPALDPTCEDYLLVTSLPRGRSTNQRVLIFSGLHGLGTLACASLLRNPPLNEIHKLRVGTKRKWFYQAVFRVGLSMDSGTKEMKPTLIKLHCASPLKWKLG